MVFVKTDTNILINLDNIERVYIEESESYDYVFLMANVRKHEYILARYNTLEEAKDRFENIIIGLKEKWEVLEL